MSRAYDALGRGLLGGAFGTVVLNLVTYTDMAVRGRPASDMPADVAQAGLEKAGVQITGSKAEREARASAAGALSGMTAGLGAGVAVSLAREYGLRLSPVGGAAATGALAMLGSDGPATLLGLTDPRTWATTDWVSDIVPHAAYGFAAHQVVRDLDRRGKRVSQLEHPASLGLLTRSFVLGVATGCRSSLGLAGAAGSRPGKVLLLGARGAERAADKSAATPSRLETAGVVSRASGATIGAIGLAARDGATSDGPVVAGLAGAAVGTTLGAMWREAATESMSARAAALVEDGVAIALAALAVRGR